jgi:hypothetical protein
LYKNSLKFLQTGTIFCLIRRKYCRLQITELFIFHGRFFLWKSVIHHLYKMKSYDFHPHNFHHYSIFTQVGGLAKVFWWSIWQRESKKGWNYIWNRILFFNPKKGYLFIQMFSTKVQLFWEGLKSLKQSPTFFWRLLK